MYANKNDPKNSILEDNLSSNHPWMAYDGMVRIWFSPWFSGPGHVLMVDHGSSTTFRLRMLTVARTEIHRGASQLLWSLLFEEMMVFNDYINTYTYDICQVYLFIGSSLCFFWKNYISSIKSIQFVLVVHGMVSGIDEVESWSLYNWFKKWHYIVISAFSYSQGFLGSWSYDLWIMSTHSMPHKNHVIYNVYRFPGHIRPKTIGTKNGGHRLCAECWQKAANHKEYYTT